MYYPPSSLIATGVLLPLMGVTSTGTRFWIRLSHHPNPIGADDWIILVATTIVMSLGILQIFDTVYGEMGDDAASVGKKAIVKWKADYAQVIIEKVAFGSIKLSILLFYRRIFRRWSDFLRLNTALIVLIIVWTLVYLIGEFTVCGLHPEILWTDHKAADWMCMDHGAFLVSFAASDVFTDVLVIGMALLFIRRLQVTSWQKWGIAACFLAGFLSTLAGILRLGFLSVLYQYGQFTWNPPPLINPPEILTHINPIFWTNFELCFGVVATNLMTFAPLIRKKSKSKERSHFTTTDLLGHGMKSKNKELVTTTSMSSSPSIASEWTV